MLQMCGCLITLLALKISLKVYQSFASSNVLELLPRLVCKPFAFGSSQADFQKPAPTSRVDGYLALIWLSSKIVKLYLSKAKISPKVHHL
jgi:hypothetical protein